MMERRKLERFDLKVPANIEVVDQDQFVEKKTLFTQNLCAGGAFFLTAIPFIKGTQVKIDLTLDFKQLRNSEGRRPRVIVSGTVLRSESHGMAIEFDKKYKIIEPPND